jgi:hypothetical protein
LQDNEVRCSIMPDRAGKEAARQPGWFRSTSSASLSRSMSIFVVLPLAAVVIGDKLEGNHLTGRPSIKIGSARISTSISAASSDIKLVSTGKRR